MNRENRNIIPFSEYSITSARRGAHVEVIGSSALTLATRPTMAVATIGALLRTEEDGEELVSISGS
jgi:hypothetical protein